MKLGRGTAVNLFRILFFVEKDMHCRFEIFPSRLITLRAVFLLLFARCWALMIGVYFWTCLSLMRVGLGSRNCG